MDPDLVGRNMVLGIGSAAAIIFGLLGILFPDILREDARSREQWRSLGGMPRKPAQVSDRAYFWLGIVLVLGGTVGLYYVLME